MKERVERDRRQLENPLLSEIGGNKGAKGSSRVLEESDQDVQLEPFDDLLFLYLIYSLLEH